jgi:hypothetical protein
MLAGPAHAQRVRNFVASYGSDSASCGTFLSPCRTFQQAVDNVAAGGEVTAIDSAGFGGVNIHKAVSIVSPPGVEAGIVPVVGGYGMVINAGANDVVNLRGLTLEGGGIGIIGIAFYAGHALTLQDCVIRDFSSSGIAFTPSSDAALDISNTLAANNGGHGIFVQPSGSGNVAATFTGVQSINNFGDGIGIYGNQSTSTYTGGIQAVVADSTVAGNLAGLHAYSAPGHPQVGITVSHSVVGSLNFGGMQADGANAQIIIGRSIIAGNSVGWANGDGGILQSYGDNHFNGNEVNNGGLPIISPQ